MSWVVDAAAAVVRVGGADRYLYRGAVLPDGVENLAHLAAVGLVSEVKAVEVEAAEVKAEKPTRTARK